MLQQGEAGGVDRGESRQDMVFGQMPSRRPPKPHLVPQLPSTGAEAELAESLESLDGAVNYASWIYDLVAPHLGPRTLELGAGHGTFTGRIAERTSRLVAVDISNQFVEVLRARYEDDPGIEVYRGDIEAAAPHGPYDSAVLINVLEHIEDDEAALRQLLDMLEPGGRLILWVPAFEALYSEFDRKVGHFRRYAAKALQAQLDQVGYEVRTMRYVNCVGALAWLLMARFLRRTPTSGRPVMVFDRHVVPILRRLEDRYRMPVGQSIFVVAERPQGSHCQGPNGARRLG